MTIFQLYYVSLLIYYVLLKLFDYYLCIYNTLKHFKISFISFHTENNYKIYYNRIKLVKNLYIKIYILKVVRINPSSKMTPNDVLTATL